MAYNPTKYNFTGKVALVTGSSSGIGEAIATQLAQYGAQVTITGRSAEKLERVAKKIEQLTNGVKPLTIVGDLKDTSLPAKLIQESVAKFGRLDFLVNNAGHGTPYGKLEHEQLMVEFDRVYHINVRTYVQLTQLAVPYLEKTKGSVINISSIVSQKPYELVYTSSKAAVDMITKCSALELGPKGIRVNSINPGPTITEFLGSVGFDTPEKREEIFQIMADKSLMKRIGTPDDIANLASFLLSDDAVNITGSVYLSDSGFLVK